MRVTIPVIIIAVVGYAFLIAVIVLFLDKYLDLRVIAYTADASRQATNLLHAILTTGPHVEEKLVLKEKVLDDDDFDLKEIHDLLEYDYDLTISGFYGGEWEFENIVFTMDNMCYLNYQRVKGYVEMPVSIHDKDDRYLPGIASLTLMKTPLSELAFWVSQASLRIKEGRHDEGLFKSIRVGPEVTGIEIDDDEICMKGMCKRFFKQPDIDVEVCVLPTKEKTLGDVKVFDPEGPVTENFEEFFEGVVCEDEIQRIFPDECRLECKLINIFANATLGEVKIVIP